MELTKSSTELTGNKCGHNPIAPRFYERPTASKLAYDILETAKNNLKHYYYHPTRWLEHIEFSRDTDRQQRTESREAVAAVSQVLFDHVDLISLKIVQYFGEGTFRHMSVKTIAEKAKIGCRRCLRAIETLKRAGYLELEYRRKVDKEGNLVPLVAIKRLSRRFFTHLGVSMEKLHRCRVHAEKQLEKLMRKFSKQTKKTFFKLKKLSNVFQTKQKQARKTTYEQAKQEAVEKQKAFDREKAKVRRMTEIKKLRPDISTEELRQILSQEFPH